MHAAYFRVGGVHQDLPPELIDDIAAFCDPFLKVCDDLEELLTENRIFKQRNVNIGVVTSSMPGSAASPASWCAARARRGICARHSPTSAIRRLEFDIPIGKNGDNYDRYCIRMEEMRQSIRIMKQCIEKLHAPTRVRSSSTTTRSRRRGARR